jgi:hypothetical protein
VKTKLLSGQRCVCYLFIYIYVFLILNIMSKVNFGNSASGKIKHTHTLQLSCDNSVKFMWKKNKFIFVTWEEMLLSQNRRIFPWWVTSFTICYCVAAVSTIQVIHLMKLTSSQIVQYQQQQQLAVTLMDYCCVLLVRGH